MTRSPPPIRPDQSLGVLLGTMIGDALGMPIEGWPRDAIRSTYGEVREMLPARLGRGTYTDDTQMAIALAEALAKTPGRLDPDRVAERFAALYDPARGYGGNTRHVLSAIRSGIDWRQAAAEHRPPGGSWANGAAMRVAPVAVAFYPDVEAVARAAEAQAEVTGHVHPVGRMGARVQALAVRQALELGAAGAAVRPRAFVEGIANDALGAGTAADARGEFGAALEWIAANPGAAPGRAVRRLGTGGRAAQSVPAALWAFVSSAADAEASVIRAVNLGGDTDTIGAMTGALAGAYHGAAAFPAGWVAALEDGERGRDHLSALAERLRR